jgi:hypothetical protein
VTLPVTTDAACAVGREIWGYPKYVAPIETRFADEVFVKLGDELELTLPKLHGPMTSSIPVVTYTALEGRLMRTVVETQTKLRWGLGRRGRVKLLGEGRTSDALRRLGLTDATPLLAFRCDAFRAVLPAGDDLGVAASGDAPPRASR